MDQNNRRRIGHYEVLETIGKGGFGVVYLCEEIISKEKFAIKEIKEKDKSKIDPRMEIEIHKRLARKKGNRVVKIIEDFVENGSVYLVMEYCKEGSLRDYVRNKNNKKMEVLLATDVISQLCEALRLMHEENIAHRDLTPANVLIREIKRGKNGEVKRIIVKVTDFGLSKETPKNARGYKTTLGTGPFMAPEVKEGKYYTKAADVFSLGSLYYFLLTSNYLPDKQSKFDLGSILSSLMAMDSVKNLDGTVQKYLKDFIRGMLCTEEDRIKLEEIDGEEFMAWFYAKRYQIDPELRELCSHSQSGHYGRRRNSRGLSVDSTTKQKRPNKDSALGSDQQTHSVNSRCRHLYTDPETGQCLNCLFRTTTTNKENNVNMFEKMHVSEPIVKANQNFKLLTDATNRTNQAATIRSQPITYKTAPMAMALPEDNQNLIYASKQPPWPFPRITQDYITVNEYGKCIFAKYNSQMGHLQLVAILEKTTSKEDQTVKKIFELRQSETQQEFFVLEPENSGVQRPEKSAKRIKTRKEIIAAIRDQNALRGCKVAKEGYDTLWGFMKLIASKVVNAYCEEISNGRKYRIELCMNGWINLYIGAKEVKEISNLKLSARQKIEDGQFEQTKSDVILSSSERELAKELAEALRSDFRKSVWNTRRFNDRHIRCTVYTRGY